MQHKGIAHLTALTTFAATIGIALKEASADGKINFWDALKFLPVIRQAPDAFKNIGEVPGELVDLDGPEAAELVANIETHFGANIPPGRSKDITDAALALVPPLANLVNTIVNPPPVAQPAGDEALG